MKKKTTFKIIGRKFLTPEKIQEMWQIFEKYYDSVCFERFVSDLNEKTHVFLLSDKISGELIGFSTIQRKSSNLPKGSHCSFLFSGDTVIKKEYWGNKVLQTAFFWFILESKIKNPFTPVYWMLISKGFKTYMMMRRNFQFSFPNFSGDFPTRFKEAYDYFYTNKFGNSFSSQSYLIQFQECLGTVKGAMAEPSEADNMNREIAYFLKTNPEYKKGVELACITEIRFRDLLYPIIKYAIPTSILHRLFMNAQEKK